MEDSHLFVVLNPVWKMVNRQLLCAVRTVSCVCGVGGWHVGNVRLVLLIHHLLFCVCGVIAMLIKAKLALPQIALYISLHSTGGTAKEKT